MLGTGGVELSLILEFEQKLQGARYPQFLAQAALRGHLHGLAAARVRATAVGPIQGPEPLGGGTLLDEQVAIAVENQQRKGSMQNAATLVAASLAQTAHIAIGRIYQNESVHIRGHSGRVVDDGIIHREHPTLLSHAFIHLRHR
jgi:hypothetical protein